MADTNEKPLYTLWKALGKNNYNVPEDYDDFEYTLTLPGEEGSLNRQKLYTSLYNNNYNVPDNYDDFATTLFVPAKANNSTTKSQEPKQNSPVIQNTGVVGGVAGGITPGSYAQEFAAKNQGFGGEHPGRTDLVESLNKYGESLKTAPTTTVEKPQGNVASLGKGVDTKKDKIANEMYIGLQKVDPKTGEAYSEYTGASKANTDVPSELQGRDLYDENGNLITVRQWQSKEDERPNLYEASFWKAGDLEYTTALDSHVKKAQELGMQPGKHSGMSIDELKAERKKILDRYANGFTETPESLQDAIDLNNIDYELTAKHLGYKSSEDMMKNHRGEADFELNKDRLNQGDLDFYEKQGSNVYNLGDNPLYVFGWQKFEDFAKENERLGLTMSVEDYINYLMKDPDIESKFYAWTLTRAKKNNRSWASNINEAMDDFRKAISRGENPWEYAPEEKDVMAEFYGGELDRMDAEYEKELEAWQKRYDAWSANKSGLGWSHAPLGSYAAETGDNALGMIHTAQNLSKDARSVIDEAMKTGRGFSLSGEVGASVRGFRDSALDWRTWTFGIADLEDSKNMYNVAKKWKDGGQLNKAEQMLLDQMVLKAASDAFFNDYLSTGYEAGKTTGYALEFIAEMLTGAGAATDVAVRAMGSGLKKLGKKKVVQLLERIGMKGIVDGTLKKLGRATAKFGENKVGKVISKAIDKGAKLADEVVSVSNKGIGQTLGPGIAKVGAQTFENATGQAKGQFNPNTGRMEATSDSFADGMDFFAATKKAVKSEFGQNASEFLGDALLEPGIKWVNKFYRGAADKAFKKFGMKEAREFLDSLKGNDWYRFVQDFRKQVHYNGSFGEYCEEVANNIYDAAFVGDQNFNSPDDPNSVFNFKKNFRTYVSCKYMSLAFGAANVASYRTPRYRANQDVKYADQIAKRAFVGEDWGSISSIIRDGSDEQVEQLMVDIAQSKKYNARQRQAAINYAGAVYAQKGIEAGDSKVERSVGEQEARDAYGRGYNMANLENISETSGVYNQLRAQMEQDYGEELMQRMDNEPGLVYNWVRAGAVSGEDAQKVLNYLNAKMAYDGAMDRLNDDDAAAKAAAEAHVDDTIHTEENGGDGQIHPVALKGREGDFFVVSGNVATDNDGNVDVNASDNDIVVVDSEGKRIMTHAKDIAQVGDAIDPEAAKADALAQIDGATQEVINGEESGESGEVIEDETQVESTTPETTTTGTAAAQGALPVEEYNQDDLVTVEVDGQQIDGIISNGLDSDGNITIHFDKPINGRQNWQMTPEQLNQVAVSYTSRDGQTISRESGVESVENPQEPQTPQEPAAQEQAQPQQQQAVQAFAEGYFGEGNVPEGWVQTMVDNPAVFNSFVNEVEKVAAASPDSDAARAMAAYQQALGSTAEPAPVEVQQPMATGETPQAAAPEAPAQEQAQQAPTQPSLPIGEDGNADFSNATPQEAHDYIYNDPELDEDEANQAVQNKLKGAQNRLDQAQAVLDKVQAIPAPNMEDYGEDTAGYKRAKRERNEAIAQAQAAVDAAQRDVDLWNGVQAQHMMSRAAANAAANREENPAAPAQTQPAAEPTEGTQEASAPQSEENGPVASTTPTSSEENAPIEGATTADERIEQAIKERIKQRAQELANACGIPVTVAESLDDLTVYHRQEVEAQHEAGQYVNGFYDPRTNEIVLYLPDIMMNGGYHRLDITYLHEGAAHGGLRALFQNGKDGIKTFNDLCDEVWNSMSDAAKLSRINYNRRNAGRKDLLKASDVKDIDNKTTLKERRDAADEYMAQVAEGGVDQTTRDKIIVAVRKALRKLLRKVKNLRLSDREIVDLLAQSRRNLEEMDKVEANQEAVARLTAQAQSGNRDRGGIALSANANNQEVSKAVDAAINGAVESRDGKAEPLHFSVSAMAEGAGFEAMENDGKGNVAMRIGDKLFTGETPITVDEIKNAKNAPINYIMEDARALKTVTEEQIEKIYNDYASMLNRMLEKGLKKNGGFMNLAGQWRWIAETAFRTVHDNSDDQYGQSIDISTICKKNEAVINAISKKQVRQGFGVTPNQILHLYENTHAEGYQVPCPVCYVFSHYLTNGRHATIMINGWRKYGDRMADPSTLSEAEQKKRVKWWTKEYNKAVAWNKAHEKEISQAKSDIQHIEDDINKLSRKILSGRMSAEEEAQVRKKVEALDKRYRAAVNLIAQSSLDKWIKCFAINVKKDSSKNTLREDSWREIPDEMALDFDMTAESLRYNPGVQRLRSSDGSSGGKYIHQASNNEVGEVLSMLGLSDSSRDAVNPWLEASRAKTEKERNTWLKKARDRFKNAVKYMSMQSLRGGQRMWSWSDNIESLAPDVYMNLMQLQLLGGTLQSYSKQLEGIDLVARMGGYVNGSLMGAGKGYRELTEDEVERTDDGLFVKGGDFVFTTDDGETVTMKAPVYEVDGKYYTLEFDDVVGVSAFGKEDENGNHLKGLFELNYTLDKAGNILVGMNDMHNLIAMSDPRVFFIIPYHKSGLSAHMLMSMYNLIGVEFIERYAQNYEGLQEDTFIGQDEEVLEPLVELWESHKNEEDFACGIEGGIPSDSGKLSDQQKEYRALRNAIFTDKNLENDPARLAKIKADVFLRQVYDAVTNRSATRMMQTKDTQSIYPYEYWDENSTYDNADVNGARYVEYCRRMGVRPKFSGMTQNGKVSDHGNFVDAPGYWKTLIDRRMYDTNGNYQGLDAVDTEGFNVDLVDPEVTATKFPVTRVADAAGTERIVDRTEREENEMFGEPLSVNYDMTGDQAVKEFNQAVKEDEDSGVMFSTSRMAPNGEPSNLDERQYEEVRTPQFKEWAGDWELAAKLRMIIGLTPIPLKRKRYTYEQIRAIYESLQNGVNKYDGRDVEFVNSALGKILGHQGFEYELLIPKLKETFDESIPIFSEKEKVKEGHKVHGNFEGYHNYLGKVSIDGKTFYVRFTVQELHTNPSKKKPVGFTPNQLHSAHVSDIKIYDADQHPVDSQIIDRATDDATSTKTDAKLQSFLKSAREAAKNSTKIVDKNGEPLVVYHGSFKNFNIFKSGFFTDSRDVADSYSSDSGRLYEVYLDIKNPIVIDNPDAWNRIWLTESEAHRYGIDGTSTLYDHDDVMEDAIRERNEQTGENWIVTTADDLVDAMKNSDKYDGVIIKDVYGDMFDGSPSEGPHTEYIPKDPTQIKSATDNNGDFSRENPDIRFSTSAMDSEHMDAVEAEDIDAPQAEAEANNLRFSVVEDPMEIAQLEDDLTINPKKKRVEKLWVQEKFADNYREKVESDNAAEPSYEANNLRFSVLDPERDADLIAELDEQEYVTVYRTMAKVNGEYYPPMDSRDHDNPEKLRNPEKLGQYTQSEERPDLAYPEEYTDKKTGEKKTRWKFNLRKSNGKSVDGVAYNPYMHTSDSALNDQFSEAQDRDDLVVVECRVPVSELDPNSYHAEKALDPVGWKPWKAGPIVSKMTGKRNLLLSRWVKPVKELSWSEVADKVSKQLGDQFDVLPSNTFSKGLRAELEKRGYKFIETDNKGIIKEGLYKGVTWSDRYYDIHPELDKRSNKKAKRAKVAEVKARNAEAGEGLSFSTSEAVATLKDDERVYNDFLGKVFSGVSNGTRRGIVETAMRDMGNDFGAATESWLMGLADNGKFAQVPEDDWRKVKDALSNTLRDNGVDGAMTDNEARYVLWKAGQIEDGVFSLAEDIVMQDRLLPGESGVRFSTSAYDVIKAAREAASGEPYANGYGASSYHHGTTEDGDKYTIRVADHPLKWENLESHGDLDGRVLSIVVTDDPGNVNDWEGRGFEEVTDRDGYDVEQYILNADDVDTDMLTDAIENYKKTGRSYGRNEDGELVGIQESGNGVQFSVTPRDRAIARDQYERWMKNGRLQWVEAMQDSMLGLKKLMQAIMGERWTRIEDVAMYENPYIAENLMSSVTAAQQQAFYTEFMKPLLKEVGKLCKGGKKAREQAREDLTNYLMAKHGLERNQVLADRDAQKTAQAGGNYQEAYAENRKHDYSGLTALTGESDVHAAEAKAQQMVAAYEAQHDTKELWKKINAATQVTLEKQYRSGILSYAEYQRISGMFDYYVPLRGWAETTSDQVYGYLTSKAGPFLGGSIVKPANGRTTVADDPIANIAQMGDDSIRTGNRNLMKQRFLNFVQNHPSDLVSVSDLWLQYDAVTDEWVPAFAKIDPKDSADVVLQKIDAFEQQMQQLASQEPTKYKHGREAANIPYRVIPGMEKEHQVLVKRNGQTWVLTINGNPRAAQALNGLTNPDVQMKGGWASLIKGAEWVNRTLSALYTTLSPAFIVSNFLRDTGYSNTMVWVREKPSWHLKRNYPLRFNYNYLKLNPAYMRFLLGRWEKGELDESKRYQKYFKEFMLNGGETGFAMVQDLEKYKKNMLNEVKDMNSKNFAKKGAKILGSQYELLGRSIENCARFAAYVTSREMGRSAERAAYDAKEISVNFNKKGSGGKMLDHYNRFSLPWFGALVSGLARSLYTFWNAGVQGMTNAGRAVKRHPVKAALLGVGPLYAAGFLAPILAQLMGAGGDGDDDKNAYYNLPEYVRRSNLCIWLGDAWLTIPLPIEFRSIYGMGELTYGVISGNERYSDEELAMQIAGQFSQLLPIDMLEGGGGFHPFIPTLFKPLVEAEQNKSWSGLPIYRDSEWNKDEPEYTKAFSNANEWIVSGAEWLNAQTGGDEFKKGWIDLNPAKIEYMLKGYLGGIYTTIDEVRRAAETALGKRDFEWRNIPLANRVIKQGDERTESKKLRDEYFKYKEDYEGTKRLINKYKNAEDTDLFDYAKKLDLMNNSKEYGRYLIFEKYSTMLEAYQKAKKGASGEVLKKIEEDEKQLMRQLVDEMHNFEDGKTTVGDRPKLSKKDRSEDYSYMYNKLRTYVDINEDALLDSALKRATAAGDKGLVSAIKSIKRSIGEMKKGLGHGKDEEVMNSIREMRNSVLRSFGIIGGEEEVPEPEEQWTEEPEEDFGDEVEEPEMIEEPIEEPYFDDEDDDEDYI